MTSPTSATPPNGNGNGSYTQKEMLAMVIARLDAMTVKLDDVTRGMAVHEAKPFHDAAKAEIDELRHAAEVSKNRLAAYAGGIAVGVFAIELAARFLN